MVPTECLWYFDLNSAHVPYPHLRSGPWFAVKLCESDTQPLPARLAKDNGIFPASGNRADARRFARAAQAWHQLRAYHWRRWRGQCQSKTWQLVSNQMNSWRSWRSHLWKAFATIAHASLDCACWLLDSSSILLNTFFIWLVWDIEVAVNCVQELLRSNDGFNCRFQNKNPSEVRKTTMLNIKTASYSCITFIWSSCIGSQNLGNKALK